MLHLLLLSFLSCARAAGTDPLAKAWTADELIAANTKAKGGLDKIKAIKSLRYSGRFQQSGFSAQIGGEGKAPDRLRQTFTMQNMTEIEAYDGKVGWKISPFEGRKDAELLGEDAMRGMVEDADFYGHLIDYKQKGTTAEFLGKDQVDGDDALLLKLTLKNGDQFFYYLDPDTLLEIRVETVRYIRGAVHEHVSDLGSYKRVNGVYFAFSFENGTKAEPGSHGKVTIETMRANIDAPDTDFSMPAVPQGKKI